MPASRPAAEFFKVQQLLAQGHSQREVSELTGISRACIANWSAGRLPRWVSRVRTSPGICPDCGRELHPVAGENERTYTYLLGLYLGDGTIFRSGHSKSYGLRIACDRAYPEIMNRAANALECFNKVNPARTYRDPRTECALVESIWHSWPCLFPQHGPGRKHHRRIVLEPWQQEIVEREPEGLLRGLIHSDGWRGLNRVRVKGRDYAYPRDQFSNRSDDIRRIFTDTCDLIGVEWRPWGRWNISVAKRESVARLDAFIGPKG